MSHIIGIDIGSASLCMVELDRSGIIVSTGYCLHKGKIFREVLSMLDGVDLPKISGMAVTCSTPHFINCTKRYDNHVCLITAASHLHARVGSLLNIGGERFGLFLFDEAGNYLKSRMNTPCAAGTGSFLDQQAVRLNLSGSRELCRIARSNTGPVPLIASRCAVFAKTDIIHAQQEGYSLSQICDGLCFGMARNITDTLFTGEDIRGPVVSCGGVSKNAAVIEHISRLTGKRIIADGSSHLYGAMGAAFCLLHDGVEEELNIGSPGDLIVRKDSRKAYAYEPLELSRSSYPDFNDSRQYVHLVRTRKIPGLVETDIYRESERGSSIRTYVGIDIGSTSTKAVLMGDDKQVIAGFYTRTSGKPVDALAALFEAIDDFAAYSGVDFHVIGSGTTGSGRKLVAGVINADLVVDEISAHARSAYELNPEVDTIIEIGGQDSKFTSVKNGSVTFCAMNTVCAAGTGSFIEEQAARMDCPLHEFAGRTRGRRSPMSSDRCTVFMERDMNYYLGEGFSPEEILSSVLHSVRENYLAKVASQAVIGNSVCFQGATAKNKALVAAFEQRLARPIQVSKYCHVTGALGVAIMLADEGIRSERFRGFGIYEQDIPVRSEVCTLCPNHCKLTLAVIGGQEVAYGFLCGRDYRTNHRVNNNVSGFDPIKARAGAYSFLQEKGPAAPCTIGLPAALHLRDDLEFWQFFFQSLSIRTITSTAGKDTVRAGRNISGAEFCAPLTALYAHVHGLLQKADYVFLPIYLEERQKSRDIRRQYCYYTQYAPSLVSGAFRRDGNRILMPLVKYLYSSFHTKKVLYRMFRRIPGLEVSFREVSSAWDAAVELREMAGKKLVAEYHREISTAAGLSVVLLGRPYSILSPDMNKGIIDLFSARGIKVFTHDMLPVDDHEAGPALRALLDELPWKHAAEILHAADLAASTEGLYPVFVTSFRCSPDSFAAEYFRKLMHSYDKPYLILQLDEHDSNIGYETRIEAAIRSFRNHSRQRRRPDASTPFINISRARTLAGKTLIFPNWDPMSCRLVTAVLRREGVDALLMEQSETSLLRSLSYNSGQCIPINIMTQGFIDAIRGRDLDPGNCLLWMIRGEIACNLKMIPGHIKTILDTHGQGMERAEVYQGDLSFLDISPRATLNGYLAFLLGGLMRRLGCRIRPYELEKGRTDRVMEEGLDLLQEAFLGRREKDAALEEVIERFHAIPVSRERRPRVAIIGDLYVRDNDFSNQGLVRFIEEHGGEVITTPYTSYVKMIARPYFRKWAIEGKYRYTLSTRAYLTIAKRLEKRYCQAFEPLLQEPERDYPDPVEEILADYHLLPEHTGESMDNILKIHYLRKYHKDISLFVQASPAFCCPALVTEAMSGQIEEKTGIPVVSITYDGTCSPKNGAVIPYLAFPRRDRGSIEDILIKGKK